MRSLVWGIQNGGLSYPELAKELFDTMPPEGGDFLRGIRLSEFRIREFSFSGDTAKIAFSVVIPTFNRKHKLLSALSAAVRQDDVSRDEYEIIVVDDGSSDGTRDAAAQFAAKHPDSAFVYVRSVRNRGPAFARNLGILAARGSYVVCTDDDCLVDPGWLAGFKNDFLDHPEIAASGGFIRQAPTGRISDFLNGICIAPFAAFAGAVFKSSAWDSRNRAGDSSNICYRKRVLEGLGGFNHFFRFASEEDWELKIRMHKKGLVLLYNGREILHEKKLTIPGFIKFWLVRGWGAYLLFKIHPEFFRYHFTARRAAERMLQEAGMLLQTSGAARFLVRLPFLAVKYLSLWGGKYFVPVFLIKN